MSNSKQSYFGENKTEKEKSISKEAQDIIDLYDLLSTEDKIDVKRIIMNRKLF